MAKRWTVERIMSVTRGCQPACVLFAAVELNIFTILRKKPMSARVLANELGADMRATTVLLDALAAMNLLTKKDTEYSVPPASAKLLAEESIQSIAAAVRHHSNCLRRWVQLAEAVKSGRPAVRSPSIRGEAADEAAFIDAMNNFSAPIADEIIRHLGPLHFRNLLDIGCASGTWTIAFLRAVPEAKAMLFDLPEVIKMAGKRIAEAELTEKVTFQAGDFYTDDLPAGADFAWLSAIAHQNSREQNRALFDKIYKALVHNGVLVVRDVVMDKSHTSPEAGAMFAVNMLVSTEGGGTYTFDEFHYDLTSAGFSEVAMIHRNEAMNSLIRATKA